ncbi:hypothetical protein [Amycolatopsis sp. NPDC059021]|uniref:hypothetical protein n=1 Tax=Amycolatopsis sp. NPDC059021 TaxID=3346704 RepID=UPI00366B0096
MDVLSDAGEFGPLRPCVEDQLGTGAIPAAFGGTDLADALARCASGQELITAGHENDVVLAAQVDVSTTAPVLTERILRD